jgi:hypothetical protein
MKLSDLPKDVLVKMALSLDLPEILYLCQTSKQFNRNVCENNNFWMNKYMQDFPGKALPENSKLFYKNMIKLNSKNIADQLFKWILTNIELSSVQSNRKAFKHNGKYSMKVKGDDLELDYEDNYVRLLPENITLETAVYLPNAICLINNRGINHDDRGTEDANLEFRDFHDTWRLEKGYHSLSDIANAVYKIKSHKFENWYEWIQTIKTYQETPDCTIITFKIDHGS